MPRSRGSSAGIAEHQHRILPSSAAIPEPAPMALLGLGLLAMIGGRRKGRAVVTRGSQLSFSPATRPA